MNKAQSQNETNYNSRAGYETNNGIIELRDIKVEPQDIRDSSGKKSHRSEREEYHSNKKSYRSEREEYTDTKADLT